MAEPDPSAAAGAVEDGGRPTAAARWSRGAAFVVAGLFAGLAGAAVCLFLLFKAQRHLHARRMAGAVRRVADRYLAGAPAGGAARRSGTASGVRDAGMGFAAAVAGRGRSAAGATGRLGAAAAESVPSSRAITDSSVEKFVASACRTRSSWTAAMSRALASSPSNCLAENMSR